MDINTATIVGRLTRDIELREVGESTVTNFTVAVNGYKDTTDFINCVA